MYSAYKSRRASNPEPTACCNGFKGRLNRSTLLKQPENKTLPQIFKNSRQIHLSANHKFVETPLKTASESCMSSDAPVSDPAAPTHLSLFSFWSYTTSPLLPHSHMPTLSRWPSALSCRHCRHRRDVTAGVTKIGISVSDGVFSNMRPTSRVPL